jgi:hypothetical protein
MDRKGALDGVNLRRWTRMGIRQHLTKAIPGTEAAGAGGEDWEG